jgi:hypothetical protein
MDFIERIAGLSPDSGQGWTELMIVAAAVLAVAALAWRWRARSTAVS